MPLLRRNVGRRLQFALWLKIGQHAGTATNPVAHFYLQADLRTENHVCARAKLDQSHTLPASQTIAYFRMENDSSRQQPGDLFKHNHMAIAFHANDILLVFFRRSLIHCVQEFSTLIANLAYYARNR